MRRILLFGIAAALLMPFSYTQAQVDFEVGAAGDGDPPDIFDDGTGWDGELIRITYDGQGGQSNGVTFDSVPVGDYATLAFDFDIRIWNEDGAGDADGVGFAFAHQDEEDDVVTWPTGEEPDLLGSLGIGFDTWSNQNLDPDFENGTLPNSFSLHYDAERLVSVPTVPSDLGNDFDIELDLTDDWLQDGDPKRVHVEVTSTGLLSMDVTNIETEENVQVFDGLEIPDFAPYEGRVTFRGRTGGENSNQDIDNVSITVDGTTTVLYGQHVGPDGGGAAVLRAGDADQDLDFDQIDLVQVQIAGKYLTGAAATWGDGDWDAAPGGSVGSPPAGNGLFDQLDIIGALNAGIYLTGPYAAIADGGMEGDGQTSVVYDPGTGEVKVDAPAGTELTSVNIDSAAGIFTGAPAESLGGSFDNDADDNIFKATFGGSFGSVSFGNVAQTGLSKEFVLGDLSVVGSLNGGGDLGSVDLVYVPEPSAVVLTLLALVGMLVSRRHR